MADFFQRFVHFEQYVNDLFVLLLLELVVQIVPQVSTALTHQPTLIELNSDLNSAQEVIHRFFAQFAKPITVADPFFVRLKVTLGQTFALFLVAHFVQFGRFGRFVQLDAFVSNELNHRLDIKHYINASLNPFETIW